MTAADVDRRVRAGRGAGSPESTAPKLVTRPRVVLDTKVSPPVFLYSKNGCCGCCPAMAETCHTGEAAPCQANVDRIGNISEDSTTADGSEWRLVNGCKAAGGDLSADGAQPGDRRGRTGWDRRGYLSGRSGPAARAHALGRAGAVLSHDTSKELQRDEIPLIRNARLLQFTVAGVDWVPTRDLRRNYRLQPIRAEGPNRCRSTSSR